MSTTDQVTETQAARTPDVYRLTEPATAGQRLNERQVTSEWSALRDRSSVLREDIQESHHDAIQREFDARTTATATAHDALALLDRLEECGLSWALVARLVGVTPTAVRKWRRGEAVTAENRRSIAKAVAALDLIDEHSNPLQDPGTWLEMPVSDLASVTPADFLVANRLELALDLASGRLTSHAALDSFDKAWRDRFGREQRFSLDIASDGQPVLTEK
jgi:transcriptional regulator with XRE-family HTH domain